MAVFTLDWAAHRFGSYVDWRVAEYARLIGELAGDEQDSGSGSKKRSGRSSGSSPTAKARKRQRMRDKLDLFNEAIRNGLPMEEVAASKPKRTRSLRELVGAR